MFFKLDRNLVQMAAKINLRKNNYFVTLDENPTGKINIIDDLQIKYNASRLKTICNIISTISKGYVCKNIMAYN